MKPTKDIFYAFTLAIFVSASAAHSAPVEVKVDLDVTRSLEDIGSSIKWLQTSHAADIQERIKQSIPNLMTSLSALAAENDHLVEILKAMRVLKTFPDDPSVLDAISSTVRDMKHSLEEFTETMKHIDPDVATKPEVSESLFTFGQNKRDMLNKLERFTNSSSGVMQSHKVDLQVLDEYIDGMSKIVTAARDANAKLAAIRGSQRINDANSH